MLEDDNIVVKVLEDNDNIVVEVLEDNDNIVVEVLEDNDIVTGVLPGNVVVTVVRKVCMTEQVTQRILSNVSCITDR